MKNHPWVTDWEQGRITRQQAEEYAWKDVAGGCTVEELIGDSEIVRQAVDDFVTDTGIRDFRSYDAEVDRRMNGVPVDLEDLLVGYIGRQVQNDKGGAMGEEWIVALASAASKGETEARTVVGVCIVSQAETFSHVAICPDQESAAREAAVIANALGLPLYDGADTYVGPVTAEGYIDLDGDGTDQYAEAADLARRNGAPVPQVGVLGRDKGPGLGDRQQGSPGYRGQRVIRQHYTHEEKDGLER